MTGFEPFVIFVIFAFLVFLLKVLEQKNRRLTQEIADVFLAMRHLDATNKFLAASKGDLLEAIAAANPNRNYDNLHRRMLKIAEELGEASEAYLNVSSPANLKKKSFADLREELLDVVIVAVDCVLTPLPGETASLESVMIENMRVATIKLDKWAGVQKRKADGGEQTDD